MKTGQDVYLEYLLACPDAPPWSAQPTDVQQAWETIAAALQSGRQVAA